MATHESPAYESPVVSELGSLDELTQSKIYKNSGTGDMIVMAGAQEPAPGSGVTSVS